MCFQGDILCLMQLVGVGESELSVVRGEAEGVSEFGLS